MGISNSCFCQPNEVSSDLMGESTEVETRESGQCSGGGVEEVIERSKLHWSTLTEVAVVEGDEVAEVSNLEEFLALQRDPSWGGFFQTFGYELLGGRFKRVGELVMGKKFVEGGQAELYDCKVKWRNSKHIDEDIKNGRAYVLKVFKKGTYLNDLKSNMPQGLLKFYVEDYNNWRSPTPIKVPRFFCNILCATLLKDGRFAFLMQKEHLDLRQFIDGKMKVRSGKDCGPFSKEEGELIMFDVAMGVDKLHRQGIVHRDLKASNVLVKVYDMSMPRCECFVADYECSVGVVGTGFFRAPEILLACKDRKVHERPEVFSKAADIYGFGMICYEVLVGKLPFEGYPSYDFDHILNGQRPLVPEHVEDWIQELLHRCWQSDPTARPSIEEVLSVILTHSYYAIKRDEDLKRKYGKYYREGYRARESRS